MWRRLADRCWALALALILEAIGSQVASASMMQSDPSPGRGKLAFGLSLTALGVLWVQRKRRPLTDAGPARSRPEPAPAGTLAEEWLPTR